MARSKRRVFSVPWYKRTDLLHVGLNEPLPEKVVEALLLLPLTPDASEPDAGPDRGVKRRKIESEAVTGAICISKSSLKFSSTPLPNTILVDGAQYRHNIGQYFRLNYDRDEFGLNPKTKEPTSPPPIVIHMLDDVHVKLFGTIASRQSGRDEKYQPGGIWTNIDVTFIAKDGFVETTFDFRVFWNETADQLQSLRNGPHREVSQMIIDALFPPKSYSKASSPMDFYDAAYLPSKDDVSASDIQTPSLESTLFPYQKRTLKWMLGREGVKYAGSLAAVAPLDIDNDMPTFDTFRAVKDIDGNEIFVSDIFHTVTRDKSAYQAADRALTGGILAEEMGLGKTLEILGLITLHKLKNGSPLEARQLPNGLFQTGATLIVAPESLRRQWMTEISNHAPTLRLMDYKGCRKMLDDDADDIELLKELDACDVIITTYSVLSQELHYATEAPERSRRHERVYKRQSSPLVRLLWWRVCLDEAQMIENGVSQAAAVARLLPRIHAWGITGTPVKDDVKDLLGLLQFLRYQPFSTTNSTWAALMEHKPIFEQLFHSISLRHTKAMVRSEILLPPQKRYVISMPFSAVEEQHYQSLVKEMMDDCKLTVDGTPTIDDWEPEEYENEMRSWLTRLRQSALHPEVGTHNRRALGYSKERPMRTVDEVLNAMLEQSEASVRGDERSLLSSKLARGQIYENSPRVKEALSVWEEVKVETAKLVKEARHKLTVAIAEEKQLMGAIQNGKADQVDDSDSDLDMEANGRLIELRRRLRGTLELHHKAVFFCASANFQIRDNAELTEPDSEEFKRLKKLEDDGYEEAKAIRREILQESYKKANGFMTSIRETAASQSFTEVPELVVSGDRGVESGRVMNSLEVLYDELNEQANILDEWREHVIQLLLKPLVDQDDDAETTGEELVDSAKFQDDLMVYFQALKSAIADRQDAISGQTNELVKHETEYSIRLAKNGGGPAPEKLIELLQKRAELKPKMSHTSMRGAIGELRGLQLRLSRDLATTNRDIIEGSLVTSLLNSTQKLLSQQIKVATALDSEVDEFKDAMNARLEYYRALQVVSDAVIPYDGPKTDAVDEKMKKSEEDLKKKLAAGEAKHRYLMNLKENGSKSNEPRMCVICQTAFVTGVLTVCGHQFCKECMMLWFKSHKNCPVCKRPLKADNLHDITIKPQQLQVVSEVAGESSDHNTSPQHQERQMHSETSKSIYKTFNADKLAEIKSMELDGPSFTTKVDTLVRHLLWLRESDPGAKSIVFSQYKDFLYVLQNALKRFRIGHASIDEPNGTSKFKEDPAIECFLLHARAHSSGLNLVNASHVFLCEPLLNTAIELQAIARVDRIGQQHETTVWLYIVTGTVEESIYNLSVRRRMEHLGRGANKSRGATPELLDSNIEQANTLELERAALSKLMSKDRSAGEMVENGDLWECLFGSVPKVDERDDRLQERAVMSYLAAEAADKRA